MFSSKDRTTQVIFLLSTALFLKLFLSSILENTHSLVLKIFIIVAILILGAGIVIKGTAKIIEDTTDVLKSKTGLAGGLLQSIGTAFPDMVLGVVAALISLRLRDTNYALAINYAVIAAATTFGSNIYNVGHAAWCVYRQNASNRGSKKLLMFPYLKFGGELKPLSMHVVKPTKNEFDAAIRVSTMLSLLTAVVAVSMVLFGRVTVPIEGINENLYQLIRPVGVLLFILAVLVLFVFRKTERSYTSKGEESDAHKYYDSKPSFILWLHLIIAGVAILFTAESMVEAIRVFCTETGTPFVVAGVLSGMIGCLGEMLVVHNFSIHPEGRIGDAIVGVAMDNIVTVLGASLVAIMGGIFLGGSALILIFVLILALNTVLIWQISELRNFI